MLSSVTLWLGGALIAMLLLGCARESELSSEPVRVTVNGSGQCLAEFSEEIKAYSQGRRSYRQVGEFWDCVSQAVRDFERITAGEGLSDNYRPRALVGFLRRYFYRDLAWSDDFVASLMEVKRVFLGGDSRVISRAELGQALDLLTLLKEVTQDLNPHARKIFLHDMTGDEDLTRLETPLRSASRQLGVWLDAHKQSYAFTDLSRMIGSIEASWQPKLVFVPALKRVLIAGSVERIDSGEWTPLAGSLVEGYLAFLGARSIFKDDLNSALMRRAVPQALLSLARAFEIGITRRQGAGIPSAEFAILFTKLGEVGVLPQAFTEAGLSKAWDWLIFRLLSEGRAGDGSFKVEHVRTLRSRMSTWLALQDGQAPNEFITILAASPPLSWDSEGRMFFSWQAPTEWEQGSRRRMLWPYFLIDWLKDSYVGDAALELESEQMRAIAAEILPVLHGFGWLKETTPKIGPKLLRESDLFTASSNGDGKIQVHEATRYLAFVASAFRSSEIWIGEAKGICTDQEAECVRSLGGNLRLGILDSMPRLKASLEGKGPEVFSAYFRSAEETVLGEVVSGKFGVGDMLQAWMILQYVETFLARFDQDASETISEPESRPAETHFNPTLLALLPMIPGEDVPAFFTFLLKYGKPFFELFGGQVMWNHWRWHRNDWQFEADREKLVGILNALSKASATVN